LARTIYPAHTPWDGDTVFALSTARRTPSEGAPGAPAQGASGRAREMELVGLIGALAAEALALAVLRGVRAAKEAGGLPAAASLPDAAHSLE